MSDSDARPDWTDERLVYTASAAGIEKALLEIAVMGDRPPTHREVDIIRTCVMIGVIEAVIQIRENGPTS